MQGFFDFLLSSISHPCTNSIISSNTARTVICTRLHIRSLPPTKDRRRSQRSHPHTCHHRIMRQYADSPVLLPDYPPEKLHHSLSRLLIEFACRLVREDKRGLADERPRYTTRCCSPPLSSRSVLSAPRSTFEAPGRRLRLSAHLDHAKRQLHVFIRCQDFDQSGLEHEAISPARSVSAWSENLPSRVLVENLTGGRPVEPAHVTRVVFPEPEGPFVRPAVLINVRLMPLKAWTS